MNDTIQQLPSTGWYEKWQGKIDAKLMCLQNSRGEYLIDKINERNLKYLNNNCLKYDWKNHLLLILLIESDRNIDAKTLYVI